MKRSAKEKHQCSTTEQDRGTNGISRERRSLVKVGGLTSPIFNFHSVCGLLNTSTEAGPSAERSSGGISWTFSPGPSSYSYCCETNRELPENDGDGKIPKPQDLIKVQFTTLSDNHLLSSDIPELVFSSAPNWIIHPDQSTHVASSSPLFDDSACLEYLRGQYISYYKKISGPKEMSNSGLAKIRRLNLSISDGHQSGAGPNWKPFSSCSPVSTLSDPNMNFSRLSCFSSVSNPHHPHRAGPKSDTMESQKLALVSHTLKKWEEWSKLQPLCGNEAAPVCSPTSTQPQMFHHINAGAELPRISGIREHDKSITPSVAGPPDPDIRNEPILTCIINKCCVLLSERGPKNEHEFCSAANTVPCDSQIQLCPTDKTSRPLAHSLSVQSLNNIQGPKGKTFTRSESLPNMTLQTSFEDFTPDVLDQENEESDESYSFRCCRPGLYRCRVTGLLFLMDGEGEVVYRTVPWDRRLLAQYGKKPAGPLFDITCVQQSVCQLHLPHCEISSTGGRRFLWVAHVNHDGLEIIRPHQTTETHVIINISGFSGYGNIKDEDSPAVPIRAMVLLFYRPSADPDEESVVSVLMLPKNVPLLDVQRTRKKLVGEENYIETHSQCKLLPYQEYTLSSFPQDNTVLVQPPSAEFDSENYDNFIPSFQVILETLKKHIKLMLTDSDSSHAVWQTRVCFPSSGLKKPCWLSPLNLPSDRTLLDVRTSFIDGVSEPVLKSLLDHLLQKEVIADCEMGSMKGIWDHFDKARSVIDLVRNKGEAASSIMIEFLCKKDPFFSGHLGLI